MAELTLGKPDSAGMLDSAGIAQTVDYARFAAIFRQGDACDRVLHIQAGAVKLSVVSKAGREAVVAVLGPGDFFGEGVLIGQRIRTVSASAIAPSTILLIKGDDMVTLLHEQQETLDRFIAHVLSRNIQIQNDLLDQLLHSSEKRLARKLMMLAGHGRQEGPEQILPWLSQEMLAEMIGTTRSRVNLFLNKFKKLGYVNYSSDRSLVVNPSLLRNVLG